MPTLKPRKQPKQKRSRQTVDAIVAATARVLKTDGYEGLNTNRVAEVAGVSVGSLYQYFPNKQALVLAVVEAHNIRMLELLEQHTANFADASIHDVVRSYVRALLAVHAMDPELHRVLVQQVMHIGLEHARRFDHAAQRMVERYLRAHADEILPRDFKTAAYVLSRAVEAVTHLAVLDAPAEVVNLDDGSLEREVCALVLRYLVGHDGEEPQAEP